ncbi:MAG TPA: LysR family transcriptional regulator [Galbitalea sp.]|jgi:DNA-binding transcriptional LysR family regulator|nr:LysR family transcriptional regulator [Galbitalea sp.]
MANDLNIRLLRQFVVLADELHFSRAAARLFITQQALSRNIRQLERDLGAPLVVRTTRQVTLTASGAALRKRANQLLALNDEILGGLHDVPRSLTVDVIGSGLTPALVLASARASYPREAFFTRFIAGGRAAVSQLLSGEIDVTFGRFLDAPPGTRQQLVRYEPITALVPIGHPLAELDAIPVDALLDLPVCFRSGDYASAGWEHAAVQLLKMPDTVVARAHPNVYGADEIAAHLRSRDAPILSISSQPRVAGSVEVPLVDPIPLFPVSMLWRDGFRSDELQALRAAATRLADENGWLTIPSGAWLPSPQANARAGSL